MKIDGYDTIDTFGLNMYLNHDNPFGGDITNQTSDVPSMDGSYLFRSKIGKKTLKFTLDTTESDEIKRQQLIYKFIAFLYDSFGKPRDVQLIFDYAPDRYVTARLNSEVTPDMLMGQTSFELTFIACDPYNYLLVNSDDITWGSETITFESSILLGSGNDKNLSVTENTTYHVFVNGLALRPVITITGTATNLVLTNGDYSIAVGTFTNKTVVIDCAKYRVTKNGVNAFNDVHLRDFYLLNGENNIAISGTGMNFTISISFKDKYL